MDSGFTHEGVHIAESLAHAILNPVETAVNILQDFMHPISSLRTINDHWRQVYGENHAKG